MGGIPSNYVADVSETSTVDTGTGNTYEVSGAPRTRRVWYVSSCSRLTASWNSIYFLLTNFNINLESSYEGLYGGEISALVVYMAI